MLNISTKIDRTSCLQPGNIICGILFLGCRHSTRRYHTETPCPFIKQSEDPSLTTESIPTNPMNLNIGVRSSLALEFQLKNAVTAVGTSPDAVRHFLKDKFKADISCWRRKRRGLVLTCISWRNILVALRSHPRTIHWLGIATRIYAIKYQVIFQKD